MSNSKTVAIALAILGVCDGLRNRTLDISEAEILVFSPRVMRNSQDCDGRISEAIHMGTELDDIRDLVPDDYDATLERIRKLTTACLKDAIQIAIFDEGHWTDIA